MSNALRATSQGYGNQIKQIDKAIAGTKAKLAQLEARRTDVDAAKKAVDEQIAKLPPEKKPTPAARK